VGLVIPLDSIVAVKHLFNILKVIGNKFILVDFISTSRLSVIKATTVLPEEQRWFIIGIACRDVSSLYFFIVFPYA
jgi:hypothetical protein